MMSYSFALFFIFNTYDDLTFFAIIELMTVQFDSMASIFSLIICLLVSCCALYFLVLVMKISMQATKLKAQISDANSIDPQIPFYKCWERYQVLYAGFKDRSLMSQSFLFWLSCRIILTYIFVGLLHQLPLVQTIQLTLISMMMLYYLVRVRPFHDPVNFVVTLVFEVLVLVTNIFLVLLAIFDALDSLTVDLQHGLSEAILIVNTIIDLCGNIFMWMYLLLTMWSAYKTGKKYGASGKTSWLNILVTAYQNPGMDFHDFSNYETLGRENSLKAKPTIKQVFPINLRPYTKVESVLSLKSVYGDNYAEILTRMKAKENSEKIRIVDLSDTMDSRLSPKNGRISVGIELKNDGDSEIEGQQPTSLGGLMSPTESPSRFSEVPTWNKLRKNSGLISPQSKVLRFNSTGDSLTDVRTPKRVEFLEVPNASGEQVIKQKSRLLPRKFSSEQVISFSLSPMSSNRHLNDLTTQNPIIEEFGEALSSRESSRPDLVKEEGMKNPVSGISLEVKNLESGLKKKRVLRPRTLLSKQLSDAEENDNSSADPVESIAIASKLAIDKSGLEITKRDSEGIQMLKKPVINSLDQSYTESQNRTMERLSSQRGLISQLFFGNESVTPNFMRKRLMQKIQSFKSIDHSPKKFDL